MSLPTADSEEIEAQSTPTVPGEKRPEEASSSSTKPEWISELMMSCSKSADRAKSGDTFPIMITAPDNMRLVDRDEPVFDPVLVSIGPFHHSKFPAMEDHKTRILSSMLLRLAQMHSITPEEMLIQLVDAMKIMEEYTRGCYPEAFPGIDFPKMMVYDGCFILEIFRMHAHVNARHGDDPIFFAPWMLPVLVLDIVKLENQIPYLALNKLYRMTTFPTDEPSLEILAGKFLALLCPAGLVRELPIDEKRTHDHLLAVFHSTFTNYHCLYIYEDEETIENCDHSDNGIRVPFTSYLCLDVAKTVKRKARALFPNKNAQPDGDEERNCNSFPSVTDLHFSGIKVVKKKAATQRWDLLDIEYRNRRLEVPALVVDHSTKILMRNLVAYEQCNRTIPSVFTSYVTFIDALVNSAEDVEALRVAGVINHFMNSNEEVSKLLNSLTANIKYDMNEGYLADINMNVYRDHHGALPQLRARFKRLVNSREGIVYIVTLFALYLTVLQTVFGVLAYVHPL